MGSFLREAAADMLLTSMRIQRDKLKAILTTAGGCQLKKQNIIFNFPKISSPGFPGLATDRRLSTGAEQGVRQVSSFHVQLLFTSKSSLE